MTCLLRYLNIHNAYFNLRDKKLVLLMPQLVPFYFLNQLSFSFLTLIVLIVVLSKFILPIFTYRGVVRMYLTKLTG